jgi:hypothetical protein
LLECGIKGEKNHWLVKTNLKARERERERERGRMKTK